MSDRLIATLAAAGLLLTACSSSSPQPRASAEASTTGSAGASAAASASAAPSVNPSAINPSDFVTAIDNPYLSFVPGTTFVYEGIRDGERQRNEVVVTDRTTVIMGVTCVVVEDTATHGDRLLEKTEDWYAQDRAGNVWYFGEATASYDDQGKVESTEGSWEAGVNGATPGIVMPAHPKVTDSFRQEFYAGHAEDMFWVVSTAAPIVVPFGNFDAALQTLEWTPLEPDVVDAKYYVAGVGLVLEVAIAGGDERGELVSIIKP